MEDYNFRFNDNSSLDFDIMLLKIPDLELPQRDTKKIYIPGRGWVSIDQGTYKNTSLALKCGIEADNELEAQEKIFNIKGWLSSYDGEYKELILSNNPDIKYYAKVISKLKFVNIINDFWEFNIIFDCKPLKKSTKSNRITKITKLEITRNGACLNPLTGEIVPTNTPIELNNGLDICIGGFDGFMSLSSDNYSNELMINYKGTAKGEPILTLYGQGDITITLGSTTFTIKDVIDYVIVNSELIDCYKDTELWNHKMIGDFPVLLPGENKFSWIGNLDKFTIDLNVSYV